MVTEAAPAPESRAAHRPGRPRGRRRRLRAAERLLRRFQARHRDNVTLVDLASKVCPTGRRARRRSTGMQLRPDGHHFTPTAATWAAHWLADTDVRRLLTSAVLDAGRRRPRSGTAGARTASASGGAGVPPALMVAVGGWPHRWMDEDAFINLRIVDQIFAGHGPVFNAGERVEAGDEPDVARGARASGASCSARSSQRSGSRCSRVSSPRSPRSSSAGTATRVRSPRRRWRRRPGRDCSSSRRWLSCGTSRRPGSRWASCGCGSPRHGSC